MASKKVDPMSCHGMRVTARTRITEGGFDGHPKARFPSNQYIHAEAGESGVVVYMCPEQGLPTVRFSRTGTATIVGWDELRAVS